MNRLSFVPAIAIATAFLLGPRLALAAETKPSKTPPPKLSVPEPGPFSNNPDTVVDAQTPKRNWGTEQVLGEPNTEGSGDIVTAWASRSTDGQMEWILVEFAEAANARAIVVHETYNPGAIIKVAVFDPEGNEFPAWVGIDPTPRGEQRGTSIFPIDVPFKVKQAKVYIDSPRVEGWNEIDAIGLSGDGDKTQWAIRAEASSTYADQQPGAVQVQGEFQPIMVQPVQPNAQAAQRIAELQEENALLKAEIEALKQELAKKAK